VEPVGLLHDAAREFVAATVNASTPPGTFTTVSRKHRRVGLTVSFSLPIVKRGRNSVAFFL
jgi:hypothetical protein